MAKHLGAPPFARVRLGLLRRAKAMWTKAAVGDTPLCLLKPLCYMNRSGTPTARVLGHLGLEAKALLAVVDDIHLPVGKSRLRPGGGAGGHKGLASVRDSLGTQDFARLRIGVGSPAPGADLSAWVLAPADPEDRQAEAATLPVNIAAALAWAAAGVEEGQAALNSGAPP